jgi:hypothetical protein
MGMRTAKGNVGTEPKPKPKPIGPKPIGPKTNITEDVKSQFDYLVSGKAQVARDMCLMSCFLDGKPTSAICMVSWDDETREVTIAPVFVAVTDEIMDRLSDHDGAVPENLRKDSNV